MECRWTERIGFNSLGTVLIYCLNGMDPFISILDHLAVRLCDFLLLSSQSDHGNMWYFLPLCLRSSDWGCYFFVIDATWQAQDLLFPYGFSIVCCLRIFHGVIAIGVA